MSSYERHKQGAFMVGSALILGGLLILALFSLFYPVYPQRSQFVQVVNDNG